jgi:hypothetical protein
VFVDFVTLRGRKIVRFRRSTSAAGANLREAKMLLGGGDA